MNSFCKMPFNSLEVIPNGTCQVCCKISKSITREDGTPFSVMKDQLDQIWNSKNLADLRNRFLNNERPEECNLCWTEEAAGIHSLRLQQNSSNPVDTVEPKIRYISLKLSNKCNLACRICSTDLSSLWVTQFKKLNIPLVPSDEYFHNISLTKFNGDKLDTLKELSKDLNDISVYGGEPLINDEALAYLTFLADTGLSKNIQLTLNTNGTVYTDEIINMLTQFKRVNFFLSIDDIGTRFEYQRWPAKWTKIDENIKNYCNHNDQIKFWVSFFPTLSILNILNLEEILDKLQSYGVPIVLFNIIHTPEILCLKNMPLRLKKKVTSIIDKIDFSKYTFNNPESGHKEFIKNFINLDPDKEFIFDKVEDYYAAINNHMHQHDVNRSTLLAEYLPDLYAMLTEN